MQKILEFWIITNGGIPVFSYSPDNKLNPSLISSFFSALQSYALEITEQDSINYFSLGNYNYNFLRNTQFKLYFIAKSDIKSKPEAIEKHLQKVAELFINTYNKELERFDGNITKFEPFQEQFDKYFKKRYIFF